jgi:chromosomal replication initiator protein
MTAAGIAAEVGVLRAPSISTLIRMSAATFRVTEIDVTSARQDQRAVRARHVAMYLVRDLTGQSYPAIGRRFGNRDHTSVMHAVRRIGGLIERDAALAEQVAAIRRAVSE